MQLKLESEQETLLLAAKLWHVLPKKCLVFLYGDLGAGKTSFTRGVLREAGITSAVKSPTYTLVEEYDLVDGSKFFHFDLYRLKDPEELEWMGIRDYLEQKSVCFVEWPELGSGHLPKADIEIKLIAEGLGRTIKINILSENLKNSIKLEWKNKDIVV
jgi:tRNA threonylcarbamoyladenosine biosynthesis protein TsaE